MTNHPTGQQTTSDDYDRNINSTRPSTRLCDLPPDILYRIASKLPPKEFAKTSVLSTEWFTGCMRSACPRLTFDVVAMCKCEMKHLLYTHVWRFVREVDGVLRKHHGKVVETLQIRISLADRILAPHIDTWVGFAAISRTKNLTLDLKPPRGYKQYDYLYAFPFHLFDQESISRLQHLQLSFVSLDLPSQFKGFPNLRMLHLQIVQVNRKGLEHVLSHCCTLEWLCIHRCRLDDDQLTLDSPLPRLLYLRVDFCSTKIRFNAANLATFEYHGGFIPIDLVRSFKLQSANIKLLHKDAFFQRVLISLLNGLPRVTLDVCFRNIEKQWFWDNTLKFTNLEHLQLSMLIVSDEDVDKVLCSLAFLMRVTPLIEKLEVHFASYCSLWLAEAGPSRRDLGKFKYVHLKHIWITGFRAAKGQLEFLLHLIENAPALEILLVEIGEYPPNNFWLGAGEPPIEKAMEIARTCVHPILSQNITFDVKE
ncbi:hypothetical protein HU200_005964 [Digitaria exilis]|uniref:F-box domain-containing protein n=1 Tax=Digitaria exilis TaxID=1010633 RepID=A0A835KTS8_9POAL|nr:hypothetical protein HU200_005964 [Digitaria exilis]